MQNAVSKLDGYGQKLRRAYGLNGQRAYFSTEEVSLGDADDLQSLPALQEWVGAQIAEAAHAA